MFDYSRICIFVQGDDQVRRVQLRSGADGANNREEAGGGRVRGEQEHHILGVDQGGDQGRGDGGVGRENLGLVQRRDDQSAKDRHTLHVRKRSAAPHDERGGAAAHGGGPLQIPVLHHFK